MQSSCHTGPGRNTRANCRLAIVPLEVTPFDVPDEIEANCDGPESDVQQ
jgi:hypothetical protein